MQKFTLKQLAQYFNKYNENTPENSDMCEHYKNEWILRNKGNYHFERLEEEDIIRLRTYLKCWILSVYEYLFIQDGEVPDS